MTEINFRASFVKPVTIQQYSKNGYRPLQASFVKCDVFNKTDLDSLGVVAEKWGLVNYAKSIYKRMLVMNNFRKFHENDTERVYMLTLPQDSYEKIEDKNVLGCVLLEEQPNKIEINYLQVNPKYTANKRLMAKNSFLKIIEKFLLRKKDTEYKYIGRGILDSIKDIYKDKNIIELITNFNTIKFYEKNGFMQSFLYVKLMQWHRNFKNLD